jgi:hypothetical protein
MEKVVRQWFEQVVQASPHLPDGWFGGRAFEGLYSLEDVQVLGDTFAIRLSEDTSIVIVCPKNVLVQEAELSFESFDRAFFRWKEYGGTAYREKQYFSGTIRLVQPPG